MLREEPTERVQAAQPGIDARNSDGQTVLPKPFGLGAEAHRSNEHPQSIDSRQQRRERVRQAAKSDVTKHFNGPRKGLRHVAKAVVSKYWKSNKRNRLFQEAERRIDDASKSSSQGV